MDCDEDERPVYGEYLPTLTKKPFIGGGNSANFLKTRFTLFTGKTGYKNVVRTDPVLFNHLLADLSEKELMSYIDLFNVEYVGTRNPAAIKIFGDFKRHFKEIEKFGDSHIFKVISKNSWFIEGSGMVKFDYDRILLTNASQGKIILKTHQLETLKTDPPVRMTAFYAKDNPVPFIQLENDHGYKTILIYNGGIN